MEDKKRLSYLRAKKKVETLKAFYGHLLIYVIVNLIVVLISANVFNSKPLDFKHWSNYAIASFWGIGLFSHAIYVFFEFKFNNVFLKRWEEKKIKQFLEEQ
ncbi:2TM domain-containing protein [Aequorivita xiaoshiensis]|uniref:2TM domain-containing protein n=1 Tax=Aequorivita xiaoshiensis TaxID=2874476 RepID=A0A9X1QZ21_9FLAO|nr:2TM domain-containing protein [Aequorivita xiaoshiensis]MCG2430190.1 2TM domain-containing protein [Aequorivita xiaoshiensis]